MKKQPFFTVCTFFALMHCVMSPLCAAEASSVQGKFCSVDIRRCFDESLFVQKQQDRLIKFQEEYSRVMSQLNSEVEKLKQEMNDPDVLEALSAQGKEAKQALLQQKERELQMKSLELQEQNYAESQKFQVEMKSHIEQATQKIAQDRGFDYALISDVILFHKEKESIDITNSIIQEMNSSLEEKGDHKEDVNN